MWTFLHNTEEEEDGWMDGWMDEGISSQSVLVSCKLFNDDETTTALLSLLSSPLIVDFTVDFIYQPYPQLIY